VACGGGGRSKLAAQPSGLLPERVAGWQARQAIVRGTAAGTWRL
jgi:hypothetical protein